MSRILRRPMFRGGRAVSSYGNGIASGLANGGRVNLQTGGAPIMSRGGIGGVRTPNVPTSNPNFFQKSGSNILNMAKNVYNKIPLKRYMIPSLGATTAGTMVAPLVAAGSAGYGIGSIMDYVTKSGDTPEAYAYRKEASKANPFLFDETSTDEFNTFTNELTEKDKGEKYGFFPQGGKAQRLKDLGLDKVYDSSTGERITEEVKETNKNTNNFNNTKDTSDTQITEEDYISMLGGDKARRRDVGDMLTRASALALKRGKPGEGKRTFTDIASDIMAAESAAGPSRLERIEEKAADYKIKDKIASKRNKESIELMKAQVDYQKRKDIFEVMSEQQRGGASKKDQIFMAVQTIEGTPPQTITDEKILNKNNLTQEQAGKTYILERKNDKNVTSYIAVKVITDQNGNLDTKVLAQR